MSSATEAATSAWFSLFPLRRAGDVAGDSPVAVSALIMSPACWRKQTPGWVFIFLFSCCCIYFMKVTSTNGERTKALFVSAYKRILSRQNARSKKIPPNGLRSSRLPPSRLQHAAAF